MARPLRIDLVDGWYHVTARGNERRDIFRDDGDRLHFLDLLGQLRERFALGVQAYVLMRNHYHLIVRTPEANLSQAMHWFNVSYSVWFNRRHQRSGHLFQGRFKAIVVDRERWGLALSRYVHLNPVRTSRYGLTKAGQGAKRVGAGEPDSPQEVTERVRALGEYQWSSYPAYLGWMKPPEWLETASLLDGMGVTRTERQAGYRQYVEAAIRMGNDDCPWKHLQGRVVLGASSLMTMVRRALEGDEREQVGLRQLKERPGWEAVVRVVEGLKGEKWAEFRDRYGDWGRDLALFLGRCCCGMKLRELGLLAGGLDYVSVAVAVRRWEKRIESDSVLGQVTAQGKQQLLKTNVK